MVTAMSHQTAADEQIPNRVSVRTDTNAGYAHRFETISDARDILDETSNTKAILQACEHVRRDTHGKERTLAYLAERLPPAELATVADLLSTPALPLAVSVTYQHGDDEPVIETGIQSSE